MALNTEHFRHPTLSPTQLKEGCRLGWDTWADTSCSGKHAYVDSFVEGKNVTATGFSPSLGSVKNLPVANVLYAYDTKFGTTLLLEHNNTIYLGEDMDDSLGNPIQSEECGVQVDTRSKKYYPDDKSAQSVRFSDGTTIPILYDGVLPYIPVRRPSPDEIEHSPRYMLSSKNDWDPFTIEGSFCKVIGEKDSGLNIDELFPELYSNISHIDTRDTHEASLMCTHLASVLLSQRMLLEDPSSSSSEFRTVDAIKSAAKDTLLPEDLSKMWNIGLATASRTLKATTHKCIRTTGLLTKRFRTDKSQLRYKQMTRQYGRFYVDYLKVGVTSIRQFIGGTLYTNKLGFKKFLPCSSETSQETGHTLKLFIEFVGLPFSMHSDNHKNFQEGLFKRLLRRFGIYSTYTEPHSPWQN